MSATRKRRFRHPIVVSLDGEPVVVVGGGPVAERKVAGLLEAGARVTVVSPEVTAAIDAWHGEGRIALELRPYRAGDLEGARLAYAATDDDSVSRAVRAEADQRRVWLNVADVPDLCDFYVPAVVRRGDLTVAVTTGGGSPGLARRIREWLDGQLGPELTSLTERLSALRERWRPRRGSEADAEAARMEAERLLEQVSLPAGNRAPGGFVFLVGAGPGDPGLLTVKGRACIEAADVVIFDALVEEATLDACGPAARRVFVGKRDGHHTIPQAEINALIVAEASRGQVVVRLKGGDPFIFGRGGEEAEALVDARIPFEVVPGVSAGSGVPACAGIPLTHRAITSELVFLTGHHAGAGGGIDWSRYASGKATLVIFMGWTALPAIADLLLQNGRDPSCPTAVIFAGSTPRQRTIVAPLARIVEAAGARQGSDTALIVVGDVVGLHEKLAWFEERLTGVE